ncbi:uncharacterized protein [Panulirus ornatus]|uniref:uncharacterized protein n=1 Tax=Panulirus ornatus TaxID=150431 RepID=UPI003A86835F
MSVICQTFVQNTWRKDLCSNCFKSKDEHGGGGRGGAGGGGGKAREAGGDPGDFAFSRSSAEGLGSGVGGGSRRYMGVAGRVYQRGYYSKSWKSIMIEKSEAGLKSPGLIKEMSSRVSQENEKNLILSDMMEPEEKMGSLRSPRLAQQVRKTSQSEAKLLTEILADKTNREVDKERSGQEDKKDDKPSTKEDDRGDVSSDLGSEASHEGSTASSGASSACSYEVTCSAANSDTASLRSEHGSEPSGEDKVDEGETKVESRPQEACEGSQAPPPPPPLGILKKTIAAARSKRGAISFNPKLEEIIGFGGDVDYSDDEDIFDYDDDDDDCDDLADLTPDERVLRQLTDKNTEFNSDNDNLKKDIEELLPSVKELEEKRKMIIAEIEELERLGRERMKDEKAKQEEKKDDKQEGKVKLKRSPPLVSTKPLIARNNNELRVNQVLPMKNGEVVRPGVCGEVEESPLKGIKPKYVAREEEMKEKSSLMEEELKTNMGKITSIDEVYHSEDTKKVKLTSIDDVCVPVIDGTVASAEVDDNVQAKLSNISSVVKLDERSLKSKNQIAEPTDSRKPVPSSSGSGALSSSQKGTSSQNSHKYEV